MAHLSLRLLGPLQIELGGEPADDFESDKVRALLAYLAVEADRPHRRDALAALLWPDWPDRTARKNLRNALSNLRQAIGDRHATPPFLLITRDTIQFNAASDHWLDVSAFTASVEADPPTAAQLEEALALYRGSFLEGFFLSDSAPFDDWSLLVRERLQRHALAALRQLAQHYESRGDYEQARTFAWRQVELEPWREEAHQRLMRLLALSGQRGAALAQYATCQRVLAEELGVEPAEETTRLYEQIRDGELERPPGVPAAAELPQREARTTGACPYRGLGSFREVDAPFFFGREAFTARLAETVGEKPLLVVVVGSSGCGKSSTVFAGLLPRLRDAGGWVIAPFRPGRRPFHALAAAVLPLLEPELGETDRLIEARKLADSLREGEIPLYDAIRRALEKRPAGTRLLFVVDQFEELYTLCPEPDLRHRLLDGLLGAVEAASEERVPPVALLLTLRADFMGHALAYRPFADGLQDGALMMGPMSRDELRRAIERPAEAQGAAFEVGLVERILDDVGEAPGNLPLLEFALTLLWEAQSDGWLTHAGYQEIGQVEGALARYADEVHAGMDEGEQEAARRIFVQLVRPGEGTEDTRRVATRAELGDEHWGLVQHLADRRLVVTGQDATKMETVEVVHEALIQRWGRLRAWMDADRAFRTWQERLRAALRGWETSERDEGALLRGTPLAQAEGWLAEREDELSAPERDFILASVTLRERRQVERERRRRNTILALAGGLTIAIVLAIFAFSARATAQREAALSQSLVLAANAEQAQDNGETDLALALALEAVDMDEPPSEAVRTLSALALGPGTRAGWQGHDNVIRDVAFSPDGGTALSGSCAELRSDGTCGEGELILWDLSAAISTGLGGPEAITELRRFEGHTGWVNALAFSPDDQTALSGSEDAELILWDVETGQVVGHFQGHSGGVNDIVFGPDGQAALSGSDDGTLILWDVSTALNTGAATGEPLRRFEGHTGGVNSVAFSPDRQAALSGSADRTLILWDAESGEVLRRFEGHINDVEGVAFGPDGRTALSAGGNTIRMWDLETGQEIRHQGFGGMPSLCDMGPDGRTAMLDLDNLVLWDIDDWRSAQSLVGGGSGLVELESAAFSPDGRLALSGYSDGTLRLWNLAGQVEFRRFATEGTPLAAVAVSPDGRRLLTGDMTDVVTLWDVESGEAIRRFEGDAVAVSPNSIAFSPDGKYALVGSGDAFGGTETRSLVLWDLETGEEIRRFEGHRFVLRSVAISPDGSTALAGSQSQMLGDEGELILWDLETGELIRRFDTTDDITSIAFSADGSRALASSAFLERAMVFDIASGEEILRPEGHTNMVFDVAFGPDERIALSASADGSIILWDVTTGKIIRRFLGHEDMVWSVEVSPDGRYVLSGSMDGDIILWDFDTAEELRRFSAHTELVSGLAFSPDGQIAFSVSLDGGLIEWRVADLPLDELIDWAYANRYVRELSCEEREQYRVEPLCDVGVAAPGEGLSGP
jgi:WD40 repeat protein/DNA-binding SARP family transcriptional activator